MSAAVFRARDARQRQHLLNSLEDAIEFPEGVTFVAGCAFEGEDTSLYLWTFWYEGELDGTRRGRRKGREEAYERVYGHKPKDAVARAKARRKHQRAKR